MANIRKIVGVDGRISYKITVSHGRDAQYRQLRHYKTFTPPPGWSEKRAEKEVQKVALQFEEEVRQGFQLDNRQLFTQYARYYIDLRESGGAKHNTILLYRHLLNMVDPHIGGLKLADIRPQHLNNLYKRLQSGFCRQGFIVLRYIEQGRHRYSQSLRKSLCLFKHDRLPSASLCDRDR